MKPRSLRFQSPLSRGTPPDYLKTKTNCSKTQVSIPSKSGHSSRLTLCVNERCYGGPFQSPLSRGTPPDSSSPRIRSRNTQSFQSPLSRGTTPDTPATTGTRSSGTRVSIPSKSGHSSRLFLPICLDNNSPSFNPL